MTSLHETCYLIETVADNAPVSVSPYGFNNVMVVFNLVKVTVTLRLLTVVNVIILVNLVNDIVADNPATTQLPNIILLMYFHQWI